MPDLEHRTKNVLSVEAYHNWPVNAVCRGLEPGRLHDLRSASVNNERLAACAAVHRLHCPLRHFSQQLLAETSAFLDGLRAAAAANPPPAPAATPGAAAGAHCLRPALRLAVLNGLLDAAALAARIC